MRQVQKPTRYHAALDVASYTAGNH